MVKFMTKGKSRSSRSPHTDDIKNIVNDMLDKLFEGNTPSSNPQKAKSDKKTDPIEDIFNNGEQAIKSNANILLNFMKFTESGFQPKNTNDEAKNSNLKAEEAEEDIGQKIFEDAEKTIKAYSSILLGFQAFGERFATNFIERQKSTSESDSSTNEHDNSDNSDNNHHHSYDHNQQDH